MLFPGGQELYLALYEGFRLETFIGNIAAYTQLFRQFFSGLPENPTVNLSGQSLVYGIALFLFIIGLIKSIKSSWLVFLYFVIYLLVLWSWPEWQGVRFIFPLLPIFVYFSVHGLLVLFDLFKERERGILKIFVYTMWIIMLFTFFFHTSLIAYDNLVNKRAINGPFDPYSIQLYDYVKDRTPPDAVIIFLNPALFV